MEVAKTYFWGKIFEWYKLIGLNLNYALNLSLRDVPH